MANKASETAAAGKVKAGKVVAVSDSKITVTDQAAQAKSLVEALPDWLKQGQEVAEAHVEEECKGLSTGAAAVVKVLAGAVAALRDRVAALS